MAEKDADFGYLIGGPVIGQLLPFDESKGVFVLFAPECTLTLYQWDKDEYECTEDTDARYDCCVTYTCEITRSPVFVIFYCVLRFDLALGCRLCT